MCSGQDKIAQTLKKRLFILFPDPGHRMFFHWACYTETLLADEVSNNLSCNHLEPFKDDDMLENPGMADARPKYCCFSRKLFALATAKPVIAYILDDANIVQQRSVTDRNAIQLKTGGCSPLHVRSQKVIPLSLFWRFRQHLFSIAAHGVLG